jgi:alkylated DNA repair dioxygenase AlkB
VSEAASWAVTAHVRSPATARVRAAVRWGHHAGFPSPDLAAARRVWATAYGAAVRYLAPSADAAAALWAELTVPGTTVDPGLRELVTRAGIAEVTAGPATVVAPIRIERPVVVLGVPRSGTTAVFEALAAHPGLRSVGSESEGIIEGVPALHPAARGYRSHALTADDAARHGRSVLDGFRAHLPGPAAGVRLLEKTPENCLRVPFLRNLLPDATFVIVRRDRAATIASLVRAWRHPGFVNIPALPGWPRGAWSFLLPPGWEGLQPTDLEEVAAFQWDAASAALDTADPDRRWIEVRQEELAADSRGVLRRLEERLGLDPNAGRHARRHERTPSSTIVTAPRGTTPAPRGGTTPMPAARIRFGCPLPAAPAAPASEGPLSFEAHLQTGDAPPADLPAFRLRFTERLRPFPGLLWVEDDAGALWPYGLERRWLHEVRSLARGTTPTGLPSGLVQALAAIGALVGPGEAGRRHQRLAEFHAAAQQFAADDCATIAGLMPAPQREALQDYYEQLIRSGGWALGDSQVPGRYGWQNEPIARFVHHQLAEAVGRLAGEPVRPSYCYVSAYRSGATLNRHRDREQCEFTVSLLLGESGEDPADRWPLHLDARGSERVLTQEAGDAVFFRGTEVAHWRPPLDVGHTYTSLLLHYVPAGFRRTLY